MFGHDVWLSDADEKRKLQKVKVGFQALYHWQKNRFYMRANEFQPKWACSIIKTGSVKKKTKKKKQLQMPAAR